MNKRMLVLSALGFLIPLSASAQSAFQGVWRVDPDTLRIGRPHTFELKDGIYHCDSCSPPYSVEADGRYHPMYGDPARGSEAVRVVDDRTVVMSESRQGQVVSTSTRTVSPDGQSATVTFEDRTGAVPVSGSFTDYRVAAGPEGAHAISGTWRLESYQGALNGPQLFTLTVSGGHLRMNAPDGHVYDVPMDGTEVPYRGESGPATVSAKRVGLHKLEVTTHSEGRVVGVTTLDLRPDEQTMKVDQRNGRADSRMSYVAVRQYTPSFAGMTGGVPKSPCESCDTHH